MEKDFLLLEETQEREKVNFKIYPNPSQGIISIDSDYEFNTIRIFNIQGKELMHLDGIQNGSNIDLTKFENGSYIIQLQTKSGVSSKATRFELIQ